MEKHFLRLKLYDRLNELAYRLQDREKSPGSMYHSLSYKPEECMTIFYPYLIRNRGFKGISPDQCEIGVRFRYLAKKGILSGA